MSSFGCQPIISVNPSMHTSKRCNWKKATKAHCTRYSEHLNNALTIIDLSSPFLKLSSQGVQILGMYMQL